MRKLFVGLMLSGLAGAGPIERVQQVRFSPDAARVMVASEVVYGSGVETLSVRVLDTASGAVVWQAHHQRQQGQTLPADWLLSRSQRKLEGLGIGPVLSNPRFNVPVQSMEGGITVGHSGHYPVKLWTLPVEVKLHTHKSELPQCPAEQTTHTPADFALSVKGQFLARRPSAKPCAFAYALKRVDIKGNRALFTVAAYAPGLEGSAVSLEFVATKLVKR